MSKKQQPFKTPHTGELWEKLRLLARENRHEPTPAEDRLWQCMRRHNLDGAHFRRQHAIERFIVDFYCAQAHLVIEVDGPIHDNTTEVDAIRQEYLESMGLHVLRFTNEQVFGELGGVLSAISEAIHAKFLPREQREDHNQVPSPPSGEGV